ncbi:MAG: hypothetical protein GX799_11950 [Crenarchaeota archaeon]|nr:hypothetical protein [Thermoproteota archaeon]
MQNKRRAALSHIHLNVHPSGMFVTARVRAVWGSRVNKGTQKGTRWQSLFIAYPLRVDALQ